MEETVYEFKFQFRNFQTCVLNFITHRNHIKKTTSYAVRAHLSFYATVIEIL